MEKIICIPTKSDKLRISFRITGEMVKDLTIGDVGMCEMDEVRKAVGKWEVPDK